MAHVAMQRLRAPGTPRVAAYLLTFITHEIERWRGTKPLFRDYHHSELAEECGCGVSSISRAVAWLRDNGKLHIVRTGRRNRYHLHAPEEKVEAPEEKVEAPLVLIKDKLPEDAPMFKSEHSECSKVNIGKLEENASNIVSDSLFEAPVPSPKELELKNLKAESKNPPSESSANVGAEGEDKKSKSLTPKATSPEKSKSLTPKATSPEKSKSLTPKATSPEKSKSLTPKATTTSTSREVSEDIRSDETPEDAICRLSPAAHIAFAEVMWARSLPSGNPVRVAQAKAIRDHLDQDITTGRGIEPVTRALKKTLEGIADLRNPMLYFSAELSRQRNLANGALKGREAIRVATAPPERGLVSEAEWERTLEGLSPTLAAMTRKTRKIITEREQEAEAQDRKQVLRKQAELAGMAEHDTTTTHKAVGN